MSRINDLKNELREYGITNISHCSCGAYTVTINGEEYSVHKRNFQKFFPIDKNLFQRYIKHILDCEYGSCNWCINDWGLDICRCGSGEPYKRCHGKPMQVIDQYTHVRGAGAWI